MASNIYQTFQLQILLNTPCGTVPVSKVSSALTVVAIGRSQSLQYTYIKLYGHKDCPLTPLTVVAVGRSHCNLSSFMATNKRLSPPQGCSQVCELSEWCPSDGYKRVQQRGGFIPYKLASFCFSAFFFTLSLWDCGAIFFFTVRPARVKKKDYMINNIHEHYWKFKTSSMQWCFVGYFCIALLLWKKNTLRDPFYLLTWRLSVKVALELAYAAWLLPLQRSHACHKLKVFKGGDCALASLTSSRDLFLLITSGVTCQHGQQGDV
jgi:hypothetical protein